MSLLPHFTLVHHVTRTETGKDSFIEDNPALSERWRRLNEPLRHTLAASAALIAPDESSEVLTRLVAELDRDNVVETVGLWDLTGGGAGILSRVIERVNAAQPAFAFFLIEAAIPAGLVSRASRLVEWAMEQDVSLGEDEIRDLSENVIADDFMARAKIVRDQMGLDQLVGIASERIAAIDGGEISWNLFSSGEDKLALISTFDMRRFAKAADVPYETAVLRLALEQVLTETFVDADFHEDGLHGTPCVFDETLDRESIVASLAAPAIHPDCLAKIPERHRDSAVALIAALSR